MVEKHETKTKKTIDTDRTKVMKWPPTANMSSSLPLYPQYCTYTWGPTYYFKAGNIARTSQFSRNKIEVRIDQSYSIEPTYSLSSRILTLKKLKS